MVGAAGRDRVRLAARGAYALQCVLPTLAKADVETVGHQPDVGAQNARHLDVADPVVYGVRIVDPVLLHQHTLHPQMRGDRRHLAGLVRLDPANRHERVATLRQRLGNQILKLARLVAAEGKAAVAVLALRVQMHLAAQVVAQTLQRLDRRGPKS